MSSMYKCKFIASKKWYPFLVHQEGRSKDIILFASVPYSTENIYVRATFDGYYSFAVFSDAVELKKYIEIFHPAYRCFDEIVVSSAQKPRFDVDIKDTQVSDSMDVTLQATLNHLLDGITDMIPSISLENNIRIYTSHGPNKRSLHLIVDGYFHDSHDNAKGFYQRILEYIPLALRQYIDHGIYGQNKQLRMEGCTKWRDVRTKTLQEKYNYRNREIEIVWPEIVDKFAASLITQVANCTLLPPYAIEKKVVKSTVISDILVSAALNLASKKLGNEFTFDYIKSMGSLILLRRISPSFCPTCKDCEGKPITHEKEHPFLRVSGLDVYFNCRRNTEGRFTHLGRIDEVDNDPIPETNSKESKGSFTIRPKEGETVGSRGTFTIRPKEGDIIESEILPTTISKVEIHKPTMKTNEIMDKFSNLNRNSRKKRTRKARVDGDSLSTMIDYSSVF